MFFLSFILGEGWQSGIQATAADWDENWDKFEDEGIPIPFLLKDAFRKQLNFCELSICINWFSLFDYHNLLTTASKKFHCCIDSKLMVRKYQTMHWQ